MPPGESLRQGPGYQAIYKHRVKGNIPRGVTSQPGGQDHSLGTLWGHGLEMVLRNWLRVDRYIYCDKSKESTQVAKHRLEVLTAQFPNQLQREAWKDAFTTTPQDMFEIGRRELISAGALSHDQQWIVVGGFECQDLSPAGHGLGF